MIQRLTARLVKFKSLLSNSVEQGLSDRLSQIVLVTDFGAKGDGATSDTQAFQKAFDAAGWGGKVLLPKPKKDYYLDGPVYIRTPLTVEGWGGSTVSRKTMPRILTSAGINAFVLQASEDGYRFEYGISGVHITDLMIEGPDINNTGGDAIATDNTINNGVYHVRECCFERNHIRYMNAGFNIRGVCYLNEWYSNRVLWSYYGCIVDKVTGATEGNSDQSRFFGNEFVLNQRNLTLSYEGGGGSQTVIGNTLSEGKIGMLLGYNTQLCFTGNQIENNEWSGVTITIPAGANPASESAKLISGNCFLFNGTDINVEKISTVLTGGFPFALRIESNNFQQTKGKVLSVSAPTGAQEFDSTLFYLASDNVYSRAANPTTGVTAYTGTVLPSVIEPLWKGRRGYQEDGAVTMSGQTEKSATEWLGIIQVPYGKQLYVKYRMRNMTQPASAGTATAPAYINFTRIGGGVVKEDTGSSGELLLTREDIGVGAEIIWGGHTAATGQIGFYEVTYCIVG